MKEDIRAAFKIGPLVLGITRIMQRRHLVAAYYVEVKRTFRNSRFVSRKLVLKGAGGPFISTIALPDDSAASWICDELGVPMNKSRRESI
ncbi:hypothetical protein [Luteibacter sp. CQ10]|uniref:hypothetical protein n=1 Tax=Luteibacter sp. CQ10 TaxID=2805821 RepID=UPI0034A21EAF